jgi:hypothetical protein
MFNIPGHKGAANQNSLRFHPTPVIGNHQESKHQHVLVRTRGAGEEPPYTAGGNVNRCNHYGNQYGGSSEN